jgi:hypothetical protein
MYKEDSRNRQCCSFERFRKISRRINSQTTIARRRGVSDKMELRTADRETNLGKISQREHAFSFPNTTYTEFSLVLDKKEELKHNMLRLTCTETKVKPCTLFRTAKALSLLESCSSPVKFCYECFFPHSRCFAPVQHILSCYDTK